MRIVFGVVLLVATGCTRTEKSTAPTPQAATPALALPIVAPMQARERLLHEMEQHKAAARARSAEFDAVLDGRDR